jgi:hypothetical protein
MKTNDHTRIHDFAGISGAKWHIKGISYFTVHMQRYADSAEYAYLSTPDTT